MGKLIFKILKHQPPNMLTDPVFQNGLSLYIYSLLKAYLIPHIKTMAGYVPEQYGPLECGRFPSLTLV